MQKARKRRKKRKNIAGGCERGMRTTAKSKKKKEKEKEILPKGVKE